jgi:hypothetical protein
MAETINYRVTISPFVSQISSTHKEGEYDIEAILNATNATALADFITAIQAGTDVSSVVTAINAL